jgi:hypothetical protein
VRHTRRPHVLTAAASSCLGLPLAALSPFQLSSPARPPHGRYLKAIGRPAGRLLEPPWPPLVSGQTVEVNRRTDEARVLCHAPIPLALLPCRCLSKHTAPDWLAAGAGGSMSTEEPHAHNGDASALNTLNALRRVNQ